MAPTRVATLGAFDPDPTPGAARFVRQLKALQLALGLVVVLVALLGGVAGAQEGGTTIGGTMFRVDDQGERVLVPDVRFTVKLGDEVVGTDTTDDDGLWRVSVPGAGTYEVDIDVDSLPEGVGLRDPERAELTNVEVLGGQQKSVLFPLGQAAAKESWGDKFDRFADLAANGLKVGAIVALASVGLSLIFGITGLVNFAHSELVTFGALVAWEFNSMGLPLPFAAVLGVVGGGVLGYVLERGLFRPLRHKRRMGNTALMVVTIGLSQFLRNVYLLFFDGAPRRFEDYAIQQAVDIGPISILPKDIFIIVLSLGLLLLVGYLLKTTRTGTAMRAVADNRDLAESSGIDVQRIILVTWVLGSALAALGGILYGTTQTVSWDMGFTILLAMFSAVVLGGLGSAYGAMVGGLVIGMAGEVSTYWLETEFKYVIALGVLIVVLLVRPQGILGVKERVG
jgi:branched-chain amino acid transport system permease protein